MPGGDRTGPMGQGPRTGRGAGYCSGVSMPGYASAPGGGVMRGRGRGGGRGWRNMFYATGLSGWQRDVAAQPAPVAPPQAGEATMQQELASLQAQADATAQALDEIRQRIDQIAASQAKEAGE